MTLEKHADVGYRWSRAHTSPARFASFGALALLSAFVACGDDTTSDGADPDVDTGADDAVDVRDAGNSDASDGTDGADTARDGSLDAEPDGAADPDAAEADADPLPPEPDWCDGPTRHLHAPFEATEIDLFPDGLLVRVDPDSPTGERLDFTPESVPWLSRAPPFVRGVAEDLNVLSGFGGLGGALLRFSSPVESPPLGADASVRSDAWFWADLGTDPPTRIPFDARRFDDGATVVLWPMVPLRLGTRHAIVVTTAARDTTGECIAPSRAARSLLFGDADEGAHDERFEHVRPRYREAIDALGLDPAEVSAITVFGTHDDLGPVRRAAATMSERPVEWGTWRGCVDRESMRQCDTATTVLDMRDARGLVDDTLEPVETEIPVMVWLPRDAAGPVPVLVFGHGLQSGRQDGWDVAQRVQHDGLAVVAMPAVEHGEHPSVLPGDNPQSLFRFLALDPTSLTIDGLALRGNIDQTNLDRLRLIHLLRARPDIDGDGTPDIDPERVTYIGASLGAVLGPQLLALSPDLDAGVLTIGGARLTTLLRDQDQILEDYAPLLELILGEGMLDRLLPVAQHVLDPADPGTWAPHVLRERFDGRTPPSVLLAVGMEDEVFSPDSGATLARAMRVPQVAPIVERLDLLDFAGAPPIAGNSEDGTRTVGFFQYDRITRGDDPTPRRPRHADSARSNESGAQLRAFFRTWAETGLPEIIDPFDTLGTAPRPEGW